MRLVSYTPLPPAPTGIADYSQRLLESLSASGVEVEAVSPTERRDFPFAVHSPEAFAGPNGDAVALYHIGNSRHHDFVYPSLFRRPGVVVLHDLAVHHARLLAHLESPEVVAYRKDLADREKRERALARLDEYAREVENAYPGRGEAVAPIAVRTGGGRLLYEYPMFEDLVRASRCTFVHSETARAEIEDRCPGAEVRRVRMGVPLPELESRAESRRALGLGLGLEKSSWIFASFGLVTPEKRVRAALRALARLRQAGVDAEYVLVGATVPHYDPLEDAREAGVAEHLRLTGRVDAETFHRYAFAADVCLNLRYPSAGETSATLLQLLACGRPVVVTDQVHLGDYPESVVHKTSLEGEEDGLYCDLKELLRSEGRLSALSANARAYAEREASLEAMTADYLEKLSELTVAM